ncbi:MAG: PEFG-CTERM sorting domain-containing protein, partial [Nitrosopumilaceae archaeon]
ATGFEGTLDTQSKTLTITVRGTDVDFITLDIPRYILDSKTDSFDSDFVVLVNGEIANFNENPTSDDKRSLTIMFPPGNSEIEILGTSVIPEFGSIAALILGVAIVSIIVVSAKSRLQLMPYSQS